MAVRSDRLWGPVLPASGVYTVLFQVPSGQTWLVKRVCSSNGGALPGTAQYDLVTSDDSEAARLWRPTLSTLQVDDHETWWALDPGFKLSITTSGAGFVTAGFGAKLMGAV